MGKNIKKLRRIELLSKSKNHPLRKSEERSNHNHLEKVSEVL